VTFYTECRLFDYAQLNLSISQGMSYYFRNGSRFPPPPPLGWVAIANPGGLVPSHPPLPRLIPEPTLELHPRSCDGEQLKQCSFHETSPNEPHSLVVQLPV